MKSGSEIKQLNSNNSKSTESERLVAIWRELDSRSNKLEEKIQSRLTALSDALVLHEHIDSVSYSYDYISVCGIDLLVLTNTRILFPY